MVMRQKGTQKTVEAENESSNEETCITKPSKLKNTEPWNMMHEVNRNLTNKDRHLEKF